MADRQGGVGHLQTGKCAQGYGLATGIDELHLLQGLGALQVLGRQLHHHPVLVQGVVDDTHLALAVGVVQGGVDHAHVQAQPRQGIAVDHQGGLQAPVFIVGVDIFQLGQTAQGHADARLPQAQVLQVVGFQGVLVLGTGDARTDAQILAGHQKQRSTGLFGKFGAQSRHHLISRNIALIAGLQGQKHLRRIAPSTTGEAGDTLHRRIGAHDGDELVQAFLHGLKRGALIGPDGAKNAPCVLLRKETLGNGFVQIHIQPNGRQQHQPHHRLMAQRPRQAGAVQAPRFGPTRPPAPPATGALHCHHWRCGSHRYMGLQQSRTHHGRGGQRDPQRDEDGQGQHHRKLMEQTAQHPAHEQNGNEHRDQRQADGHHGETNFAAAAERGLLGCGTPLQVPGDVLQHHDGVIHHKAGGNGQGHQGQVVQAVAQQIHAGKGARQRYRHRHAGDQGRAQAAQKQTHHHDHQAHRDGQRLLDFGQGGADGQGAVGHDLHVHRGRDGRLQHRHQGTHPGHRLNHVGIGLLVEQDQNRWLAIGHAVVAHILHRVADLGHVAQAHRAAIAVAQHQGGVIVGAAGLVVGTDLPAALGILHLAFGPVGVGRGHGHAHILQSQALAGQFGRVDFDAHRWQSATANGHLPHAIDLRQTLRQQGGRHVIQLAA